MMALPRLPRSPTGPRGQPGVTIIDTNDPLLSVPEVAEFLGVSDQTVRNWIRRGVIPASRAGHVFRIRTSAIHALLEQPAINSSDPERQTPRVELSGDLTGRYVVRDQLRGGVLVLEPEHTTRPHHRERDPPPATHRVEANAD